MSENEDSSSEDSSSGSEYEPTDAGKLIRFKQYNAHSTMRDRQYLIIMTYFLLFSESDSSADSNDESSTNEHDPEPEQNNRSADSNDESSSTNENDPQPEQNTNTPAVQKKKSRYSDTRKRARTGSAQSVRKLKRNCGEAYKTKNGKTVPEKKFDPDFDCKCKNKCAALLSAEEKQQLSKNFWKMGDFKRQNTYLCGLLVFNPVAHRRPRNTDNRRPPKSKTIRYFLQTEKKRVKVCKKFFLNMFQISNGRISRAVSKVRKQKLPGDDGRGKSEGSRRQLPADISNSVIQHIARFPSYQSHYTRSHNPKKKIFKSEPQSEEKV